MVKYFFLVMRSKKMKILANFMFSHKREQRSPFSQDAAGASPRRCMWGGSAASGCRHVAGTQALPCSPGAAHPTGHSHRGEGLPRRVKGTRVQPRGQRARPRCGERP